MDLEGNEKCCLFGFSRLQELNKLPLLFNEAGTKGNDAELADPAGGDPKPTPPSGFSFGFKL